jgi:hypothetical protein
VVTGVIADARNFINTGTTVTDYFSVANSAATLNFPENGNYTISAWVNLNSVANHATLISKHDLAYAIKLDAASTWEFFEFSSGSGWNAVKGYSGEVGSWQYLVGVQNGFDAAFYLNGQRVDGGVGNTANGGTHSTDIDLLIGAEPQSATTRRRPLNGLVDEVRLASVSRGADWVRLEYENQRPGQSLVSVAPAMRGAGSGFSISVTGGGALFRIPDARAMAARLEVMDLQGRVIWSYRGPASQDIVWDGVAASGKRASQGLYMVRAELFDAAGAKSGAFERRLPLTR